MTEQELFDRGVSCATGGKLHEALRAFEKAIDLKSEYIHAWNGKGNVLYDLGRLGDALSAYDTALDLNPEYVLAWNGKGAALRDLGRPEDALSAYDTAIDLNPEFVPAWWNRGLLLHDDLNRPIAARRSILRVLHVADYASNFSNRRLAIQQIPAVLDHLHSTGGAPLLITSVVEQHGLTDVYLRTPRAIGQAYEQAAPYQLLKRIFKLSAENNVDRRRKHTLLGLAAFYLGDPFIAQEHFDIVEELTDVFGPFYYGRTFQEYARNEDADHIFDVSREAGDHILERAGDCKEVESKKLYYAGQLFIAGSDPQWEKARECFKRSADQGFLPAKYMLALVLRECGKEEAAAHEQAVISVLEEEKHRLDGHEEGGREAGFLGGARLSDYSGSRGEGPSENTNAPVDDLEQLIWRCAHAAEISDAILHVYDWLEAQEEEQGQIPSAYSFVDLYDRPDILRLWALREQQIKALRERFEENRSVDLATLRTNLDRYPDMPSQWIASGAPEIDPNRQERLLGERISRDTSEERSARYQELITYLALEGRINARATLSLTAYLLATAPPTRATLRSKITEKTGEATIAAGGAELLKLAGVALEPFTSFSTTVTATLTAAFITELVKEWRDRRVDYPTFREKFDTKLEGQAEKVYTEIMTMLEAIEERQR